MGGVPPMRPLSASFSRPIAHRPGTLELVAIGASTGGPVAVQRVLSALPADYPCPVLVAVHMPAEFTPTFAERLDSICSVKVAQASDQDMLLPGQALIAPGGMQTLVESHAGGLRVKIKPGGDQLYKPSVDIMFGSVARALGDAAHAVVLTGMGADGTEGARLLKERGSSGLESGPGYLGGVRHAIFGGQGRTYGPGNAAGRDRAGAVRTGIAPWTCSASSVSPSPLPPSSVATGSRAVIWIPWQMDRRW